MAVIAMVSYDVSSLSAEFREEMKAHHWTFTQNGQRLPLTTCVTFFNQAPMRDAQQVLTIVKKQIIAARDSVRAKHDKTFFIERFSVALFDGETAVLDGFGEPEKP